MAFSGSQVTRIGLYGGSRSLYGSFAGKAVAPPIFAGTIPDISLTEGGPSTDYDLSVYFTGAASYAIDPAVEAGWAFNTTTAILTVVPDTVGTYGGYIVTATNPGGTVDSNSFGVTVTAAAEDSATGGWWFAYDYELRRKDEKKKKRQELRRKAEEIQEDVDRELVQALQAKAEEEDRLAELKRLSNLAEQYRDELNLVLSDRAIQAAEQAILKQTYSALERFERELARAREEEEFLLMAANIILNS